MKTNIYEYKYCVYTHNMCDGTRFIKAFYKLTNALNFKEQYQLTNGCCVVVKKKFIIGFDRPVTSSICNLHWYSEYDL